MSAVTTEPAKIGYQYFSSERSDHRTRQKVEACAELSRLRLHPPLSDPDYLIFELRRPVIAAWCEAIRGTDLDVLDVGGRIQPYRPLLVPRVRRFVGVDLVLEGLVDVVGNGEDLPLASDSFDVVLSNDALQYIPQPERAVREMHRVLKPGGTLILSTRAQYPAHHDEFWRFLPDSLAYLVRMFSKFEITPEGSSGAGLFTALNVLVHRDLRSHRAMRLAQSTTIPLLNGLGLLANRLLRGRTRFTCGYSVRAIK